MARYINRASSHTGHIEFQAPLTLDKRSTKRSSFVKRTFSTSLSSILVSVLRLRISRNWCVGWRHNSRVRRGEPHLLAQAAS